jgi:hypothetical protein
VFSFVLILSGIKLVKAPFADTIIEVGLGLGVAVLAAWGWYWLRQRRVAPRHRRLPAQDPA